MSTSSRSAITPEQSSKILTYLATLGVDLTADPETWGLTRGATPAHTPSMVLVDTATPVTITGLTQKSSRGMGAFYLDLAGGQIVLRDTKLRSSAGDPKIGHVVREFAGKSLPAHVGWWLFGHRNEEAVRKFLEPWQKNAVFFVDTVLCDSGDFPCVLGLHFDDGEWNWRYGWFGRHFGGRFRVATPASS